MPFLSTLKYERSVKRTTFQIVLVAAIIFCLTSIALAIALWGGSTSDNSLRYTLLEQARQEDKLTREYAARISRTGGTSTVHVIAMTRQHLHGLEQINGFSEQLLGGTELVPHEALNKAMDALDACEERALGASTIDAPVSELWAQLEIITQALLEIEGA